MSQPTIDSRALRDALSSFATGVTIVTTADHSGEPVGMTASSFNSVSMDPPLILWSVTKTALSAPVFHKAQHFSVHVLAANQMALSNRFARSGEDKFNGIDFQLDANGVPQLAGVLTRFDCNTWSVYEGGDHWIIVGEVKNMETQKGEGLVFSGGSYATAASIQPPNPDNPNDDGPIEELLIYNLARAYVQVSRRFHASVEESGLSIPEWRTLASLHGGKSRTVPELVARTFVSPKKMNHLLTQMKQSGWLTVEDRDGAQIVTGSPKGQSQVEHLFELCAQQEAEALGASGKSGQDRLIGLLRQVIENTNE
ncbi:MAG: hypothetical protein GKR97_00560 [Rhizobiaceae bacterium]|nr:hypothetical protein [Rhizobiaceae bacterium]